MLKALSYLADKKQQMREAEVQWSLTLPSPKSIHFSVPGPNNIRYLYGNILYTQEMCSMIQYQDPEVYFQQADIHTDIDNTFSKRQDFR